MNVVGRIKGMRGMRIAPVVAMAALALLSACSEDDDGSSQQSPPPPVIRSLVIEPRTVANRVQLIGRVEPFRVSEVRARTDGLVQEVVYEEGAEVAVGDVLFRIDPRIVQATLDEAEARLRSAKAQSENARTEFDRAEKLLDQKAISRQDYDNTIENSRASEAAERQAEAARDSARISLSFAEVTAPIKGRAGRAQVREGSLVSAAQATLLVTVRRSDQVYVNLAESATDMLAVIERIRAGDISLPDADNVPVELLGDDGAPRGLTGRLDFLEQTVDEQTGTVTLRAVFPNPDGWLLPGQLIDTAIQAGVIPHAIVIPQPAVLLSPDKAEVMLVKDGRVQRQTVTLGKMHEGGWLIESGLGAGDEIALDNLQKLRNGAVVRLARKQADSDAGMVDAGDSAADKDR